MAEWNKLRSLQQWITASLGTCVAEFAHLARTLVRRSTCNFLGLI